MLEDDTQVKARFAQVEEMLTIVCGEEEFPWFVSDKASLFDVCSLEPDEIMERLASRYGRKVNGLELGLPIWKLVDLLREDS